MQTPEVRSKSSRAPKRNSLQTVSPSRIPKLKVSPRFLDPTASSSSRAPRVRSPRVSDASSPTCMPSENFQMKSPSKVAELESKISQLQNDLRNVKDQLIFSEMSKNEAQKDVEESRTKLLILSQMLQESEKRSNMSAALVSALDEIERLKAQLEVAAESECDRNKKSESDQMELLELKEKLGENCLVLEQMKSVTSEVKKSEAHAQEAIGKTLLQLEEAKTTVETLKAEGCKAKDAHAAIVSELDESRSQAKCLEELINKLNDEMNIASMQLEIDQLKSAMEAADMRYNEELERREEQTRNALEMMDIIKSASGKRQDELEVELRRSKKDIDQLTASLLNIEAEFQRIREQNGMLAVQLEDKLSGLREQEMEKEINNLKVEIDHNEAKFTEKDTECRNTSLENETLKLHIRKTGSKSDLEAAKAAEREVLIKIGYMSEEIDKNNRKERRAADQFESVQRAKAEMEVELRRLSVQSEQWRKAAEVAASIMSAGSNGQLMGRTGSLDSCYSPGMRRISLPYMEGDEEFPKKKTANPLKRLGVLWKKQQK